MITPLRSILCLLILTVPAAGQATAPSPSATPTTLPTTSPTTNPATRPATRVTLRFDDAPADKVLAELARQIGRPLSPAVAAMWKETQPPRITLDLKDEPWWQAMQQVLLQGKLRLSDRLDDQVVGVAAGVVPPDTDSTCIAGPFYIVRYVTSVTDTIDYAQPKNLRRAVTIQARIHPEPGLRILTRSLELESVEAVDEHGRTLTSPAVKPRQTSQVNGPWNISTKLEGLDAGTRRLRHLRGVAKCLVQTASKSWTLDIRGEFKKEQSLQVGRRTVTIKQINKSPTMVLVQVLVSGQEGGVLDAIDLISGLRALDKDGRSLMRYSANPIALDKLSHVNFGMVTADGFACDEPVTLIWEVPTAAEESAVMIDLANVELERTP